GITGVIWQWREAVARGDAEQEARKKAQDRERAERWERYRANMTAAAGAFQMHNVGVARRALEAAPEEHRNWEWHYFSHQLDGARKTVREHVQGIWNLTYSRDGRRLMAAGRNRKIQIWDTSTGQVIASITTGGPLELGRAAFAPDGRTV